MNHFPPKSFLFPNGSCPPSGPARYSSFRIQPLKENLNSHEFCFSTKLNNDSTYSAGIYNYIPVELNGHISLSADGFPTEESAVRWLEHEFYKLAKYRVEKEIDKLESKVIECKKFLQIMALQIERGWV